VSFHLDEFDVVHIGGVLVYINDADLPRVRAGLINWNRPTTGASGRLPFGGLGRSGNHRPAGYFTVDFCNVPVGSLESEALALPEQLSPGVAV
jgi:succinylglutamic semialdehyde dehydrogenase